MRVAILAIVEDGKSPADAVKVAGLTPDAIRKAMHDNSAARQFYVDELKALMTCGKAQAAHALIKVRMLAPELRLILEESQQTPADNGMPQVPGFAILIADARTAQALPVGPVLNQIAHQPQADRSSS